MEKYWSFISHSNLHNFLPAKIYLHYFFYILDDIFFLVQTKYNLLSWGEQGYIFILNEGFSSRFRHLHL